MGLGIKTDGSLWGWGTNQPNCVLGVGAAANHLTPTRAGTATNWASLDEGSRASLGYYDDPDPLAVLLLKTDGSLWFLGNDQYYQSGRSEEAPYNVPHKDEHCGAPVAAGLGAGGRPANNWKQVSVGWAHVAAIKIDGSLWAWGSNDYTQISNGQSGTAKAPYRIGTRNDWVTVSAGFFHTLVIGRDGTLWA